MQLDANEDRDCFHCGDLINKVAGHWEDTGTIHQEICPDAPGPLDGHHPTCLDPHCEELADFDDSHWCGRHNEERLEEIHTDRLLSAGRDDDYEGRF